MSGDEHEIPLLVVDDEAPIRRSSARLLERAGYRVQTASTTAEADEVLRAGPIALVLCDVDLPGESGLALVARIVSDHPETAVVMVTGIDDAQIGRIAREHGVYGYILKPYERSELVHGVATALHRRALDLEDAAADASGR